MALQPRYTVQIDAVVEMWLAPVLFRAEMVLTSFFNPGVGPIVGWSGLAFLGAKIGVMIPATRKIVIAWGTMWNQDQRADLENGAPCTEFSLS